MSRGRFPGVRPVLRPPPPPPPSSNAGNSFRVLHGVWSLRFRYVRPRSTGFSAFDVARMHARARATVQSVSLSSRKTDENLRPNGIIPPRTRHAVAIRVVIKLSFGRAKNGFSTVLIANFQSLLARSVNIFTLMYVIYIPVPVTAANL